MSKDTPKTKEKDSYYELTPKGYLGMILDLSLDETDEVWSKLTDYVAEQAKINHAPPGIPCLVFSEGGYCVTATEESI